MAACCGDGAGWGVESAGRELARSAFDPHTTVCQDTTEPQFFLAQIIILAWQSCCKGSREAA